jgi:hypothetical protein
MERSIYVVVKRKIGTEVTVRARLNREFFAIRVLTSLLKIAGLSSSMKRVNGMLPEVGL